MYIFTLNYVILLFLQIIIDVDGSGLVFRSV